MFVLIANERDFEVGLVIMFMLTTLNYISHSNVNSRLSDIKRWIITNKLMINDSKTEFIVFRSPQLRCDLSDLSVNVGESQITQSLKVRDLGVTFDQFLNFDDHITAICRSTYFHIRNIGKIMNLLLYNACLLLFMHLLVVD